MVVGVGTETAKPEKKCNGVGFNTTNETGLKLNLKHEYIILTKIVKLNKNTLHEP